MMNLNETRLHEVVAAALQIVAGDKRWANAVAKAAEMIESNPYGMSGIKLPNDTLSEK